MADTVFAMEVVPCSPQLVYEYSAFDSGGGQILLLRGTNLCLFQPQLHSGIVKLQVCRAAMGSSPASCASSAVEVEVRQVSATEVTAQSNTVFADSLLERADVGLNTLGVQLGLLSQTLGQMSPEESAPVLQQIVGHLYAGLERENTQIRAGYRVDTREVADRVAALSCVGASSSLLDGVHKVSSFMFATTNYSATAAAQLQEVLARSLGVAPTRLAVRVCPDTARRDRAGSPTRVTVYHEQPGTTTGTNSQIQSYLLNSRNSIVTAMDPVPAPLATTTGRLAAASAALQVSSRGITPPLVPPTRSPSHP